ncbi:hypothetical protein GGR53DRAFT_524400 [Hypoxylon sp. FL1150]|nr:hypothetical protein GGR53DRAFT_524400 [Hypoxylon sp. FL1150]
MVGLTGRFRKLKLPVARGSREDDSNPPLTPTAPHNPRPPVLRNFSYPTNVGNPVQPPPFPSGLGTEQTQWDQLGEICSFSPDSVSRIGQAKAPGLTDPFFFRSDTEFYSRLDDESEQFSIGISSDYLRNRESKSAEKNEPKDKTSKLSKGQSLGDRLSNQNPVTSRLKRNSLGQHKANVSFSTSRFLGLPSSSPDRPASSSGVPLIDTRLKPSSPTGVSPSPVSLPQGGTRDFSANDEESLVSHTSSIVTTIEKDPVYHKNASHRYHQGSGSVSESLKSMGVDNKPRWLSQLKGWVSVSDPSTQAPKQYENAYTTNARPGNYQANDRLRLRAGILPRDTVALAGEGFRPDETLAKETKQIQHIRTRRGATFQGSGSSS